MNERRQRERGAVVYDFVHPGHRMGTEWPVLEHVHRRLVDTLGRRLRERFHVSLHGEAEPTRRVRYDDFLSGVDADSLVHELALGPEPGVVLFCVDAALVPALVDGWFGGRPAAPPTPDTAASGGNAPAGPVVDDAAGNEAGAAEETDADGDADVDSAPDVDTEADADADADGKADGEADAVTAVASEDSVVIDVETSVPEPPAVPPLVPRPRAPLSSATERRAYGHVLDAVVAAVGESWAEVIELGPRPGRATSVERLGNGGYGDIVVDCILQLVLGDLTLQARLVYPVALLEPFAARLAGEDHTHPVRDAHFRESLGTGLMDCELEIHGVLAETRITIAQLMAMKAGDFIPLKDMQNVSFRTRHTPLFDARVGNTNGRVSASLSRWHLPRRP